MKGYLFVSFTAMSVLKMRGNDFHVIDISVEVDW